MLRSSREGRKQAARFHAFPSSRSAPRLGPTSSYPAGGGQQSQDNNGTRPAALRAVSANHHAEYMRAEHSPERESHHRSSIDANKDPTDLSNKRVQSMDVEDNVIVFTETVVPLAANNDDQEEEAKVVRSLSGNSSTSSERKPAEMTAFIAKEGASSTAPDGPAAVSREEGRAIFNLQSLKEKTPSRGTTEDQSQTSSVLSSPPTSHDPDEGDISMPDEFMMKNWQIDSQECVHNSSTTNNATAILDGGGDISVDSLFDDTRMGETTPNDAPDSLHRRTSRLKRLQPREIDGVSLLNSRSPRVKVKTIKMVEAEESLSLSPKRARRARSDAMDTASSSDSPSKRNGLQQTGDNTIEMDLSTEDSILSRGSLRSISHDTKGKGKEVENQEEYSFNESYASTTNGGLYGSAGGSLNQQSEPAVVKRGRGRPRGSTKQKRLERLAEQRRLRLLEGLEAGQESLMIESGEDTEMNETRDESTDAAVTRRLRRLTEPVQRTHATATAAVVERQRQGRRSLPDMSGRSDKLGKEKISEIDSKDEIRGDKARKRRIRKDKMSSGSPRETEKEPIQSSAPDVEGGEKSDKPVKAPWKRKVFLSSGLYSNDYKNEDVAVKTFRRSARELSESLVRGTSRTRKANAVSALPLPCDYGYWLLQEKKDFRLPYSVAQEISEIRAKLETKKKPPPYKRISQNRYFSRPKLPGEILICQCLPSGDCGETCVNRQTEYLCHPKHCPCGERCTNIYFGRRKAVATEVQWYGARGFGLKTLEDIPKGGFIDEYRGEVIDFNEAVRRIRDHYKETGNYYFLMYDAPAGEMLDGGLKGNITRFANHSCDPNCNVQKWLICGTDEARSGEFQVALFAERDIRAGEELTYDYGWSAFAAKAVSGESSTAAPEECHCGAANCSGFLGVKKSAAATAAAAGSVVASKVVKRSRKNKKVKAIRIRTPATSTENCVNLSGSGESASNKNVIDNQKQLSNGTNDVVTEISPHNAPAADVSMPHNLTKSAVAAVTAALRTPTKAARFNSQDQSNHRSGGIGSFSFASPNGSMSTLTSLSDDDRSELESSVEEPYQRRTGGSSFVSRVKMLKRKRNAFSVDDTSMSPSSVDRDFTPSTVGTATTASLAPSPLHHNSNQLREEEKDVKTAGAAAPKRRLTLKDRVFTVLVPREKRGEKENVNLVVEGKRERKLSLKASESGEAGVPSFAPPRSAAKPT